MGSHHGRGDGFPERTRWSAPILESFSIRFTGFRGIGAVKALQVESSLCITGGVDGSLRIWDLDLAESLFQRNPIPVPSPGIPTGPQHFESVLLGKAHPQDVFGMGSGGDSGLLGGGAIRDDGVMREEPGSTRAGEGTPCVKTLDGHTKSVTSLYFDGNCLVRQFHFFFSEFWLMMRIGYWIVGSYAPSMGSHNRSMRPNDGYSLGHLESPRFANSFLLRTSRINLSHLIIRRRLLYLSLFLTLCITY